MAVSAAHGKKILPSAQQTANISTILSSVNSQSDPHALANQIQQALGQWETGAVEKKATLDFLLVHTARELRRANEKVDINVLKQLVETAAQCANLGQCSTKTTCHMVEAVVESLPIGCCEPFFALLEPYAPVYAKARDYISVLGLGNGLMMRLSKVTSSHFSGRILLWLARIFPIFHSSGTRQVVPNGIYAKYTEDPPQTETDATLDKVLGSSDWLDPVFCRTFWSLQPFFAKAGHVMTNPEQLMETMTTVLAYLEEDSLKPAVTVRGSVSAAGTPGTGLSTGTGSARKREREDGSDLTMAKKVKGDDTSEGKGEDGRDSPVSIGQTSDFIGTDSSQSCPCFLTGRRALSLELRDVKFRVTLLVQMLIFLQAHCLFWRGRPNGPNIESLPKGIAEFMAKTQPRVQKALEGLPNGKAIAQPIKHLLAHEMRWIEWKNENAWDIENGVPPLEKNAPIMAELQQRKRRAVPRPEPTTEENKKGGKVRPIRKATTLSRVSPRMLAQMKNIYNDGTNIDSLKNGQLQPDFDTFFEEPLEQLKPDSGVEKEYILMDRPDWLWSAYRLVSRSRLDLLSRVGVDRTLAEVLTNDLKEKAAKKEKSVTNSTDGIAVQKEEKPSQKAATEDKTTDEPLKNSQPEAMAIDIKN